MVVLDPPFLVDKNLVHDRDVCGGPTEADPTQLPPEPGCLGEGGTRNLVCVSFHHSCNLLRHYNVLLSKDGEMPDQYVGVAEEEE